MLQIWLILKPSLSGQSLLKPPLSAALSMTCWMMPGVKGFLPSFSRQLALFKSYIVLLSSMISSKVEPFLHCLIAKLQNVQRTFFRSPYTTPLCSLIIDSIYSEFASFQRQDIHKHSKVKNAQIQQYKHFQVTRIFTGTFEYHKQNCGQLWAAETSNLFQYVSHLESYNNRKNNGSHAKHNELNCSYTRTIIIPLTFLWL